MGYLNTLKDMVRGKKPKTWENSQEYEFRHTRRFMESETFHSYFSSLRSDRSVLRDSIKTSFFAGHEDEFDAICAHAHDKDNLEIGSSCGPVIFGFAPKREPYVIEPMGRQIVEYQTAKFKDDVFKGARLFSADAAAPIGELEGAIDGVIYIRNCIDHTPKWPFLMVNVARYARPGAKLLFWSEMNHGPTPDIGHYNITDNVEDFLRFVDALGFTVERHFSNIPSLPDLGLIATRR